MSSRVLPIGMIIHQKQSDTGAPVLGGVGARTINIRRQIKKRTVRSFPTNAGVPTYKNCDCVH